MRVVTCTAFGPVEQLSIEERPSMPCGPREVRIEVTAAGVNYVDGLFIEGRYQIKPPLPFVPGNEVAGSARSAPRSPRSRRATGCSPMSASVAT
jgi:NADPH2:quinone reductase